MGDGQTFCKPLDDWPKQRFEVTIRALIGCVDYHEGSHAKGLRKGLLFLCFGSRNCLLSAQFFSQIRRLKNGMCASANVDCMASGIGVFVM